MLTTGENNFEDTDGRVCVYVTDRQAVQIWDLHSAFMVFHFYERKGFEDEDSLLFGLIVSFWKRSQQD